jgi:uncharacterized protein YtpQ (UPF0354 family)
MPQRIGTIVSASGADIVGSFLTTYSAPGDPQLRIIPLVPNVAPRSREYGNTMAQGTVKTFVHPAGVYRLEYPAPWENLQQDEARSCGFGPKDRDDVGLWITILPFSVDTERMAEDLPELMQKALEQAEASNLRKDPTLRHTGLKADTSKDGQGGHYWVLAGGDVILFASTQVPAGERDVWNPLFDQVLSSLQITRDEELMLRKAAVDVLERLQKRYPDEDFHFDERVIRGKNRVVYLSNLERELRAAKPHRREGIIEHFVTGLSQSAEAGLGEEVWDEIERYVVPVLKPRDYIDPDSPTRHLLTSEWLVDVVICYAIKRQKFYRFITGWDVDRWGLTPEIVHDKAIENVVRLSFPERLEGSRQRDGGRVIVIATRDDLASSRLLHPDLHRLFSGPLGSPFWAGIPNRHTLVVYSDRKLLKKRIARQLKKDHDSSAYPITARPFIVTRDGIALGPEGG